MAVRTAKRCAMYIEMTKTEHTKNQAKRMPESVRRIWNRRAHKMHILLCNAYGLRIEVSVGNAKGATYDKNKNVCCMEETPSKNTMQSTNPHTNECLPSGNAFDRTVQIFRCAVRKTHWELLSYRSLDDCDRCITQMSIISMDLYRKWPTLLLQKKNKHFFHFHSLCIREKAVRDRMYWCSALAVAAIIQRYR